MRGQPTRSQRQQAARSGCAKALFLAFGLGTSLGALPARAAPASMPDVPASAPLPELEPSVDMQLAERGRLQLEDPVNQHLPPELAIPADGWEEPVQILDLMNHTAGFEEQAHIKAPTSDSELRPAEIVLRELRPRRVRKPGQLSVYSNYGADLAGAIIAHTASMNFQTYVERHLLGPLGMEHTTFREPYGPKAPRGLPAPMPAALVPDIATALIWREGSWEAVPYERVLAFAPSGSASSTASDMARYVVTNTPRRSSGIRLRYDSKQAMFCRS